MKKALLLLGLVVATSSSSFVSPAFSNTHSVSAGQVPAEVVATFNSVVADVMNNWYPNNDGYDMSGTTWVRVKGAWQCTGDVILNGGSNGITVVSSSFKNTGEFEYLNYNVIQ
jgi:hypothetical protein